MIRESDGTGTAAYANFYVTDPASGDDYLNIVVTAAQTTPGLVITAAEKVGVATTTPWGRLSVEGDGSTPSFVVSDLSDNTDFIVLADGKVGIGTGNPTSTLVVAGTFNVQSSSDASALYVNSSGNVGIGTTNITAG